MTDLITKYRPNSFETVWGHKEVVTSLQHALKEGIAHSFIFTGPSGCGKTSLSRIVAKHVNARITERNAAQYSSVDDMRTLLTELRHIPLGGKPQCYILNEVQKLSSNAFDSIVSILEEPPNWLYWCLTTTEENKVPKTLNRCLKYALKELSEDDLIDLLEAIREAERLSTPTNIMGLCARAAYGSPRLAISNFAKCCSVSDLAEASILLEESERPAEAIELIRALVAKRGMDHIRPILRRLKDTKPEGIRHVCRAYLTTAILESKDDKKDRDLFELLEYFKDSFNDQDGISPIVLTVGRILYAQEI